MNPFAKSLNEKIAQSNNNILDMLSDTGKKMFLPKGILSQSAEAKEKAHKFNATIGIATSKGKPMYLKCMHKKFHELEVEKIFPYAPPAGIPALRTMWAEKIRKENSNLNNHAISNPVVTHAITNGLSLVAKLFINPKDYIVLPDQFWGNYRLIFNVNIGGEIATYETFKDNSRYNIDGLLKTVRESGARNKKVIVVLNFPNNPTGYSLTKEEAKQIADGLTEIAESGINIIAISDDAYFGLFFEDSFKESMFSLLTGRSEKLLPIKIDGITKESFAWGLRVGFVTYGAAGTNNNSHEYLEVLETKTTGLLRGTISSCSHSGQSIALQMLQDPNYKKEQEYWNNIIKERCNKVKEILDTKKYEDEFTPYPFNSGYFMCIKLHNVDAETLRLSLLDNYGIGVISTNQTNIRIAFSCVEVEYLEELISLIYQCIKEIKNK